MPVRPFRFGLYAPRAPFGSSEGQGERPSQVLAQSARRAEDQGYSWIAAHDHVMHADAPMPIMMAIAAATKTLRVTATMIDNNLRHPILVAKEAALIDILSDGRLELGIGAGSLPFEHAYLGLPIEKLSVRHRRLRESLQIIKGMWAFGEYLGPGEFYPGLAMDGLPKPMQQPRPPIRLGGYGQRMLNLAGEEADIVNMYIRTTVKNPKDLGQTKEGGLATYGPMEVATEADLETRVQWVRDVAGARIDEIELELFMWGCIVTDHPQAAARTLIPTLGNTVEDILNAPDVAIGSVEQIAERLRYFREKYGISSFQGIEPAVVGKLAGT